MTHNCCSLVRNIFLVLYQSVSYVKVEASTCPPYVSLIVSLKNVFPFLIVIRYIYNLVSLYFTN